MSVRSVVPGSMVSMKTWFIVAVLCELTPASCATDWGYDDDNGPSVWATTLNYTTCGSESQSPVDIVIADCEYDDLGTFTLDGFENEYDGQEISMENNGHTVLIHLDGDYFVSGAGLSEYKAHYFHFHWGSDNSQGSEHEIDGDKKAAEFHLVCYNEDLYGSYTNALGKKGGIAVLGFLIEAGEPNSAFDALLNEHYNVANKDDEYTFTEPFQLLPMFPSDLTRFYRYEGSTTTPPCYENVTWTVFKEVVEISEDQLGELRSLYRTESGDTPISLVDNYRDPQDLHDRVVIYSAPGGDDRSSASSMIVYKVLLIIGILRLISLKF